MTTFRRIAGAACCRNVSRYLCDAPVGSSLTLKGPLGLGMRLDADTGHNSVIVVIAQGTGINCAFDLLQVRGLNS